MKYGNPAAITVLFDVEYGQGTFRSGREDRVYRGSFDLLSREKGITLINRINNEEYLYGVVPAEMEAGWPSSALEAQAVAARTYAIANLKTFEGDGLPEYFIFTEGGGGTASEWTNVAPPAWLLTAIHTQKY